MYFFWWWWRRRVRSGKTKSIAKLVHQRLTFERLENRCLLSLGTSSNLSFANPLEPGLDDLTTTLITIANVNPPTADSTPSGLDQSSQTALDVGAAQTLCPGAGNDLSLNNVGDSLSASPVILQPGPTTSTAASGGDPSTDPGNLPGDNSAGNPPPDSQVPNAELSRFSAQATILASQNDSTSSQGQGDSSTDSGDSTGDNPPPPSRVPNAEMRKFSAEAGVLATQKESGNNQGQSGDGNDGGGQQDDGQQGTDGNSGDQSGSGDNQSGSNGNSGQSDPNGQTNDGNSGDGGGQSNSGDSGQRDPGNFDGNPNQGDNSSGGTGDQGVPGGSSSQFSGGGGQGGSGQVGGDPNQGDGQDGSGDTSSGDTGDQGDSGHDGAPGSGGSPSADAGTSTGDANGNGRSQTDGPTVIGNAGSGHANFRDPGSLADHPQAPVGQTGEEPPDQVVLPTGDECPFNPAPWNDATGVWNDATSSPTTTACEGTPSASRGEMLLGWHGPRRGAMSGHLDAGEGIGGEASRLLPGSGRMSLASQDQGNKPATGVTPLLSGSQGDANPTGKPEESGAHFVHAAPSEHRFERYLTTRSRRSAGQASLSAGQGDQGEEQLGPLEMNLPSSVLPATGTADPRAAAAGPVLMPLQVSAQLEQSKNAADWSAWGGLAPQFLVAPFFPKRPQPALMLAIADETILTALNVALTNAGYMVYTAATARDALGVLKTPLTPVDAAVVDVNLPDVSGLHLLAKLNELYPKLPIMLFADPADAAALAQLRQTGVQVLLKSSATSDMLAQVRALVS
jgi:hypothetical protein